jgi:hypothetical protein
VVTPWLQKMWRSVGIQRAQQGNRTTPGRPPFLPGIEVLEDRTLPAGNTLAGTVFIDYYYNGTLETNTMAHDVGAPASTALTASVANGGSGYEVGDVLTVVGGTSTTSTHLSVTTVSANGAITAVSISQAGAYTVLPANPLSTTGGHGTLASFNLTWSNAIGLANDTGVGGITVTVTGSDGFSQSMTTAANGSYSINDPSGITTGPQTTQYRIEFTNLPAGFTDGPVGPNSATDVQFVTGSAANADLGIVQGADYSQPAPPLVTQSYIQGGGATGPNGTADTLFSFPFASGTTSSDTTLGDYNDNAPTGLATEGQVGATFGLAYNPNPAQPLVYAAAFEKSFAGYASGGTGAIYAIGPAGTVSLFADLNATPFAASANAGANPHSSNPVNDSGNAVWNAAGKTALGGLALNATDTELYAMNLANSTLYALGVNANGTFSGNSYSAQIPVPTIGIASTANNGATETGNTVTITTTTANPYIVGEDITISNVGVAGYDGTFLITAVNSPTSFSYTDLAGTNMQASGGGKATDVTGITAGNPLGDLQPFAVTYYEGNIYIGAVNTAESTVVNTTPATISATGAAEVGNTVTITATAATNFVVGDTVDISGVGVANYNGEFTITAVNNGNHTFQYTDSLAANMANSGNGTAMDLGNANDLHAYVFKVTDTGTGLTFDNGSEPVFEFNLNYPRAYVNGNPPSADWLPWSPVVTTLPGGNAIYPQPEFTGLTFDAAGNMTIGLRDRDGDQTGSGDSGEPRGITAGDTLQAGYNSTTGMWTLENNGSVTENTTPFGSSTEDPVTVTGSPNNPNPIPPPTTYGPGDGKFYYQDYFSPGAANAPSPRHTQIDDGGVFQIPGYSDVLTTVFDPAFGVDSTSGFNGGASPGTPIPTARTKRITSSTRAAAPISARPMA